MRQALRRKLHSQRGASMLLALLFLLLCVMVAASILMAAVANAGKSRSNLEEHQQYLALSSAVSLLCDDLNQAQYRGQYYYWEVVVDEYDGEGNWIGSHTDRYFKRIPGVYDGAMSPMLLDDFDNLFHQETVKKLAGTGIINQTTSAPAASFHHTLTLTPDTGIETLDEKEVTVTLKMTDTYAMYLTATLEGYENYIMEAELTPISTSPPTLPLPMANLGPGTVQQTTPMLWKIGWITTGQEEDTP